MAAPTPAPSSQDAPGAAQCSSQACCPRQSCCATPAALSGNLSSDQAIVFYSYSSRNDSVLLIPGCDSRQQNPGEQKRAPGIGRTSVIVIYDGRRRSVSAESWPWAVRCYFRFIACIQPWGRRLPMIFPSLLKLAGRACRAPDRYSSQALHSSLSAFHGISLT